MQKMSMSGKQALSKVWMPEVVITNRDIRQLEIISTMITIHKTGEVSKVERSIVRVNNIFELEQYPFDTQHFKVKVASSKYMLDEVELKPWGGIASGVNENIFQSFPYALDGWKVYTHVETDGALKKSRGVLQVNARRTMDKYAESHLMPSFLLLALSWGVFWFPFSQPFITPRLALSILALLSFTNIIIKSDSELPNGAPCNWNDIFNQVVQMLMFSTIIINICSELLKHHFLLDELAQAVNHEAKIIQPFLSIAAVTTVISAGEWQWLSVSAAGIMVKILVGITIILYFGYVKTHFHRAKAEKLRRDEEKTRAKEPKAEDAANPGEPMNQGCFRLC
jgi:hypothetical protein